MTWTTTDTEYGFILAFKIQPYTRMLRGDKSDKAAIYRASQQEIKLRLNEAMNLRGLDMLPIRTPLSVRLVYHCPKRLWAFDADNLLKAVLDAAQGVVFNNDMWIANAHVTKRRGPEYRAEFQIGVIEWTT